MMKNLEYYVSSAELGKEFSQIVGIIVKCRPACEHCTAVHRERHFFYMVETCENGKRTWERYQL